MGVYVHFTDEQKYRANNVDLVDFLERRGEKLIPSGREKRLSSDHSITVHGNEWYDHSSESGGYSIDFVRQFYGLSFPDAVTTLLGGEQGETYRPTEQKKAEPKKSFALPPAHSDMRRVYAYLVKTRLIDREVINFFARRKLIYESCEKSRDGKKEYHNTVFVGLDEHGVPRHAHKRGLYTEGGAFRGNVDGCDPAYSFHYIGSSNRLYVFEAPIDLLSYISLQPQNWPTHSYVSLCGLSEHSMLKMLELYPNLDHVVLCLDHDQAGIEAAEKYCDLLTEMGVHTERELSENKDWNEDIRANHGLSAIPAEEHPQQQLRDEICSELVGIIPDMKSDCSANTLSALLVKARSHLHGGRSPEAEECLRDILCLSISATAKEYQQMTHNWDLAAVQDRMQASFKTYENRGRLKTRLDLLDSDIMSLRGFERVLTAREKEKLAERYEGIAVHCLKAAILLKQHMHKQERKQEPTMKMG